MKIPFARLFSAFTLALLAGCSADAVDESTEDDALAQAPDRPLVFTSVGKWKGQEQLLGEVATRQGRSYVASDHILEISPAAEPSREGTVKELTPRSEHAVHLRRVGDAWVYQRLVDGCPIVATSDFVDVRVLAEGCMMPWATDGDAVYYEQRQNDATATISRVDVATGAARALVAVPFRRDRSRIPNDMFVAGGDVVVQGRDGVHLVPSASGTGHVIATTTDDVLVNASSDYVYFSRRTPSSVHLFAVPKSARSTAEAIDLGDRCRGTQFHGYVVGRRFYCVDAGLEILEEAALATGGVSWRSRSMQGLPRDPWSFVGVSEGRVFIATDHDDRWPGGSIWNTMWAASID